MNRAALLLLCALSVFAQGSPDLVISQVYGGAGNAGAPLRNDFIELFNRGEAPVSVAGWSVQYASATGAEWQVTPIAGVVQPGRYFLIQQAAGANTAAAALPDPDALGTIAMSGTAAKVALVRNSAPLTDERPNATSVVDLVGYGATNRSETAPAPPLSNTTAAIRRANGCVDSDDNFADFQTGAPRPRNSASAPQVDCNALGPVAVPLRISEIQGPGVESPVMGRLVVTRGIVTGRKTNGFFLQSSPQDGDGNAATSEGLLVFSQAAPPTVAAVGNLVEVTGTVAEFRSAADPDSPSLTELIDPRVTLIAANQDLPEPAVLGRIADLEWVEGMRVTVQAVRVVGPSGGSVMETSGSASGNGIFYTVEAGGLPPFATASFPIGSRLIRVDSRALGGRPALDVRTSDVIDRLTGPLDFGFRTYTINPDSNFLVLSSTLSQPLIERGDGEFAVASMNLQRLFDDRDDPSTADPVVTQAAFQARVTRIGRAVREVLQSPEIIGVEEAENLSVLQTLAQAIGGYEAYLAEGNDIGGIDIGLLVRKDKVSVLSFTQEGKDTKLDDDLLNDRPPVILRAAVDGTPVVVVVNHSRSLINADSPVVARKRRIQAEFLTAIHQREINENLISLGDYNMVASDELMRVLKSPGLVNLNDTLRPDEAYTYIQDGVKQALDHMLVSPRALRALTRYQIAHINADFPETSRNSQDILRRLSDHDVPIAYFRTTPTVVRAPAVTNAASFLSGSIAPGEWLTLFLPGPLGFVRFGETQATIVSSTREQTTVIAPLRGFVPEIHVGGPFLGAIPIAMPTTAAAPGIFTLTGTGQGQGAILNQDTSINGAESPALRESIVSIYATGLPAATSPAIWIANTRADILYAGAAPGLPPGVSQVNARVPADAPKGSDVSVFLSAGDHVSAPDVTMAIR